jgi:outer membrane protein
MLRISFSLCLFILSFSLQAQTKTYSLKDCIELALSQNIQVKQAKVGLLQAESQAKTEKLSFLPTANASGSHAYNFGRSIDRFSNEFVTSTVRNNYFSLNTNFMVYNGLQKQNTLKARKHNVVAAEKGLENAQNQIAMQVADLFLRYMLSQENVGIAENQKKQSNEQLKRVDKLFAAGSIDQGQVLNIKAQIANDEMNIVTAQNNLETSKLSLKLLMFLEPEEEFELEFNDSLDAAPALTSDVQAIYNAAVAAMPQIAQAEAQLKVSEMSYKTSLGARAPNVSAYANMSSVFSGNAKEVTGVTLAGTRPVGTVDATGDVVSTPDFAFQTKTIGFGDQLQNNFGQSVGLQVSIPIFNGNQVNNAILNGRTNFEMNKLNLASAKQQLKNDISLAVNNSNLAYKKFNAAQTNLAAQKLSKDFAEKRYVAGTLNYFDYNNARNLYINAISNLQSAKYEFLFRKMVVEFYRDNVWKL